MKALITEKFDEEKLNKLKSLGYDIIVEKEDDVEFSENIKDIEVLSCFAVFQSLDISLLKNLKFIQLFSAGINQVPLDLIRDRGILLANNRGGYSIPISEWMVLKILEMVKKSREFYENQQKKEWKVNTHLSEIYNKTIGFIGTGDIAKEGAKRIKSFGTTVLGLNTTGRDVEHFDKCYKTENIKEMVSMCDVVVVSMPYTDKTYHLINKDVIGSMKDGVYIVNISRGNIINEQDLILGLKEGKIGGAALDVFEEEPLKKESPLWDMKNVIITPHNSWVSEMVKERRFYIVYENFKRYISGEKIINLVDLNKGY